MLQTALQHRWVVDLHKYTSIVKTTIRVFLNESRYNEKGSGKWPSGQPRTRICNTIGFFTEENNWFFTQGSLSSSLHLRQWHAKVNISCVGNPFWKSKIMSYFNHLQSITYEPEIWFACSIGKNMTNWSLIWCKRKESLISNWFFLCFGQPCNDRVRFILSKPIWGVKISWIPILRLSKFPQLMV